MFRKLWQFTAALCCLTSLTYVAGTTSQSLAAGPVTAELRCWFGSFNQEQAYYGALVEIWLTDEPLDSSPDSAAIFFVDSVSVPGVALRTYVPLDPASRSNSKRFLTSGRLALGNLIGSTYYLYAVLYDGGAEIGSTPWLPVQLVTYPWPKMDVELRPLDVASPNLYPMRIEQRTRQKATDSKRLN